MEKSEPKARKLASLVDYEIGSIVTRTIIERKAASIEVYAFDKYEGIVEHVLPYETFFYVLEGMAEVNFESKPYVVKEGETIILRANKPHAISPQSRFKALLLKLKE